MIEWLQRSIETFQFADDETPYVSIRMLVEKIGLNWEEERLNLLEGEHWGYREEELPGPEGRKVFTGVPASKVFIWLANVDLQRVSAELRQPLFEYQEKTRQMSKEAFLKSDLLAFARAKEERSPLEQRLVDAADLLEAKLKADKEEQPE